MDEQVLIAQVKAILQGYPDLSSVTERSIRQQLLDQNPELNVETHKQLLKSVIRDTFVKVVEEREQHASRGDNADDDSDDVKKDIDVKVKLSGEEDELSEVEDAGGGRRPRPSKKKAKKEKTGDGAPQTNQDREMALALSQELNGRTRRTTGTAGKPAPTRKRRKAKEDGDDRPKRSAPQNAFNAPMMLSEVLASFLGEKQLSRPQVVKKLWVHIKEHALQDPNDKRYIQCDDKLREIFQVDRIHMMTMNKALTPHLFKTEDVIPQRTGADKPSVPIKSEVDQNGD